MSGSISGSIVATPANPLFDLQVLVKAAFEQQDDDQPPASPTVSDGYSSLSSLPPSPELVPSPAPSIQPRLIFLDHPEITSSTIQPKKQMQKKKTEKITPPNRQAKKTAAANAAKNKRRARIIECTEARVEARPKARLKHLGAAKAVVCDHLDSQDLPAASTGYIGLDNGFSSRKSFTLDELVGKSSKYNFTLQKWNGSYSAGLVDGKNRLIGILAGYPESKDWPSLREKAAKALETRRSRCWIPKKLRRPHRRGNFVTLNCGVSYGGGQQEPGNLRNDPQNERVLAELNSLEPFQRIAGFASSVMSTWMPKLYDYYKVKTDRLHEHHPDLVRIFPDSIFSAVSYNFGPRTVCYPHIDPGNAAFGMCAVTPLGTFDYEKGGHLILWNLRLVIEFPPGCTILFPSAVVSHSNVAVAEHETRYSFAQYTAGGLFRWVDQEFQTKQDYLASLSPEDLAKETARLEGMWEFGISLLPKVSVVENTVHK